MAGLFGSPFDNRNKVEMAASMAMPQQQQQPQEMQKPKFFGQGGVGRAIAGNVGDFLLQNSGFDPIYNPAMQQQQALSAQAAAEQRKRAQDLADWQYKQEYERANPPPVNNDTVNDYNFIADRLGQEVADQYLRNLGDPIVTTTLPGNRFYSGPRSQFGRAIGGSPPTAPVGRLTPIGGGGVSNGTGGF